MATPNVEVSDGLEIISIGRLYSGPWDKKYWSCSRGKDRYPYPVGYQAVRTHNEITYKMEILEGLNGPLFKVASTNGLMCSGQTPDIAWDRFQKNSSTRLKLWHGKRFSCKIDGVEFFGFKNTFVQRLLRELVANGSGTVERLLLSSNSDEISSTIHQTPCKESCSHADLQPYLAKPKITGKRSRKQISSNMKSVSEINIKGLWCQDHTHNANASKLGKGSQENQNGEHLSTSCNLEKDHGSLHNQILLPTANVETVDEEQIVPLSVKKSRQFSSFEFSNHLEKEVLLSSEECDYIGSKSYIATQEAGKLSKEPLQGQSTSKSVEEKVGEASVPDDSQKIIDSNVAPDTLDFVLDNSSISDLNSPKQSPYHTNEKLNAAEMVVSEVLGTESNPEEGMDTCTSNANSEKSDFDSVGQDIAKSMMTVLLPRALPLLKTFSRKKNTGTKASDISLHRTCRMRTQEEEISTNVCLDIASSEAAANMCIVKCNEETVISKDFSVVPNCELATSLVHDSFESDQCEHPTSDPIPLFAEVTEANHTTFGQDTCTAQNEQQYVSVNAQEESLTCQVETRNSELNVCNGVYMASDEAPQKGVNFISNFAPGCTNTSEKDAYIISDENSVHLIHSKLKNVAPGCTEVTTVITDAHLMGTKGSLQLAQKQISVKAKGPCSSYASSTQGPNTNETSTAVPEPLTCQTFGDDFAEERCTTTKALLTSDICPTSSSGHRETRKFSDNDEAIPDKQLDMLCLEESSFDPGSAYNNMACLISQNQKLILPSIYSDTSNFINPEANFGKVLLLHQNLAGFDSSLPLLQNQGTSFCDHMTEAKKVKDDSKNGEANTNHRSKLEGITELVGCYVHPMPISLVLLSTRGDEIYIGVLCGLLVDKKQTLFIYKLPSKGKRKGYPSFIGYTSIVLPVSRDDFGREIAQDNYGLQFTPDGLSLALLNSVQVPCCREMKIHCSCSACTSNCLEKNAVKIVQVKLGYVSIVSKLQTAKNLCCILVCDSSYLVAAEDSGKLLLWVMNSTWRDISKRILISRFSAPSVSVLGFLPISLFRWQSKGSLPTGTNTQHHVNEIMDATNIWLFEGGENNVFHPVEGDDVAVWLLISTISDSDIQNGCQSTDCKVNPIGWWRLALLMNNVLMLGSALDQRAAAVGALAGHGIIGTCDGLVYMWELSAGTKLGNLHDFKGAGVSCITTDDSGSGVLAVAGEGGKLLVYVQSHMGFTNQGVSKQIA